MLGLGALAVFVSAGLAQATRAPIIDVHVHAYERNERWTQRVLNLHSLVRAGFAKRLMFGSGQEVIPWTT